MKLKCQCCGIEKEFKDGNEAFDAGWDAPPMFSTHIACDLCPAICIVLNKSHKKAHELWEKEGRPSIFTVEKCSEDGTIENKDEVIKINKEIAKMKEFFGELVSPKH